MAFSLLCFCDICSLSELRVMKTRARFKPREAGTAALEALCTFVLISLQTLNSRTYFLNVPILISASLRNK